MGKVIFFKKYAFNLTVAAIIRTSEILNYNRQIRLILLVIYEKELNDMAVIDRQTFDAFN